MARVFRLPLQAMAVLREAEDEMSLVGVRLSKFGPRETVVCLPDSLFLRLIRCSCFFTANTNFGASDLASGVGNLPHLYAHAGSVLENLEFDCPS